MEFTPNLVFKLVVLFCDVYIGRWHFGGFILSATQYFKFVIHHKALKFDQFLQNFMIDRSIIYIVPILSNVSAGTGTIISDWTVSCKICVLNIANLSWHQKMWIHSISAVLGNVSCSFVSGFEQLDVSPCWATYHLVWNFSYVWSLITNFFAIKLTPTLLSKTKLFANCPLACKIKVTWL